jgi:hypothetical protein
MKKLNEDPPTTTLKKGKPVFISARNAARLRRFAKLTNLAQSIILDYALGDWFDIIMSRYQCSPPQILGDVVKELDDKRLRRRLGLG